MFGDHAVEAVAPQHADHHKRFGGLELLAQPEVVYVPLMVFFRCDESGSDEADLDAAANVPGGAKKHPESRKKEEDFGQAKSDPAIVSVMVVHTSTSNVMRGQGPELACILFVYTKIAKKSMVLPL